MHTPDAPAGDLTARLRDLETELVAERARVGGGAAWERYLEAAVLAALMAHGVSAAEAQQSMTADLARLADLARVTVLEQQLVLARLFAPPSPPSTVAR